MGIQATRATCCAFFARGLLAEDFCGGYLRERHRLFERLGKRKRFLSALLREAGEIFLDSSAAKDFTCAEKAFLALFAGAAGAGQPPSRPSAAEARRLRRFFMCFEIISALRAASRTSKSKVSSNANALSEFHLRSAAALEILRDSAIALEHPRAPSKSLSGARAVAPKVVAVRRKDCPARPPLCPRDSTKTRRAAL